MRKGKVGNMFEKWINKAKRILNFSMPEEVSATLESHKNAAEVIQKRLNDITSDFTITQIYNMEEQVREKNTKYVFENADPMKQVELKQSFQQNKGTLLLVDEVYKNEINKDFIYLKPMMGLSETPKLNQAPDFIYNDGTNETDYWVSIEPKWSGEELGKHIVNLELLYCMLYKEDNIRIRVSEPNEGLIEEKCQLEHFRLTKDSLFLVYESDSRGLTSKELNNIHKIRYMLTEGHIRFWIDYDTSDVTRFFIEYQTSEVIDFFFKNKGNFESLNIRIDPIVYK